MRDLVLVFHLTWVQATVLCFSVDLPYKVWMSWLVLRHYAKNKLFPKQPTNMCSRRKAGSLIASSKVAKSEFSWAHMLLSNIITTTVALCVRPQGRDEFLEVTVESYFLVLSQTNLFALLSWELYLLDSTFVMFAGQAALLSLAGESKVFFKCLNRWLPRSLEVKIKTCAWGLRAQNAIYSSSFISFGIMA